MKKSLVYFLILAVALTGMVIWTGSRDDASAVVTSTNGTRCYLPYLTATSGTYKNSVGIYCLVSNISADNTTAINFYATAKEGGTTGLSSTESAVVNIVSGLKTGQSQLVTFYGDKINGGSDVGTSQLASIGGSGVVRYNGYLQINATSCTAGTATTSGTCPVTHRTYTGLSNTTANAPTVSVTCLQADPGYTGSGSIKRPQEIVCVDGF